MSEPLTSRPVEHKKLGVKAMLHDFNQKQFEQYHELLFASDAKTVAVKNGVVVTSAIKAGFLTGIEAEAVPNMSPAVVMWLTAEVHTHVLDVTVPPRDEEEKK